MTLEEARDRVSDMVAELLALLPGMVFDSVMAMNWEELCFWHNKAIRVAKRMGRVT